MIEAEIYGMTASAKIAMRPTAPPENMLNRPMMPWLEVLKARAYSAGFSPGTGM